MTPIRLEFNIRSIDEFGNVIAYQAFTPFFQYIIVLDKNDKTRWNWYFVNHGTGMPLHKCVTFEEAVNGAQTHFESKLKECYEL